MLFSTKDLNSQNLAFRKKNLLEMLLQLERSNLAKVTGPLTMHFTKNYLKRRTWTIFRGLIFIKTGIIFLKQITGTCLQDFQCTSDPSGLLCIKGLKQRRKWVTLIDLPVHFLNCSSSLLRWQLDLQTQERKNYFYLDK